MDKLSLKRPVLLLDREKCINNIASMAGKARRHNLILRPHFKTHQSLTIAGWFRDHGTDRITVSSVSMANHFAGGGWDDICIAFPFNINEIEEACELAGKISLNLTVCSEGTAAFIARHMKHRTGVYIKLDAGSRRTGIPVESTGEIDGIIDIINNSDNLAFRGFMVHNGHTYRARSVRQILEIHREAMEKLMVVKNRYISANPGMILSVGDTPACSVLDDFAGIDEIRPGNYVFYDLSQTFTGSCRPSQIAVALAAPVVAKHRERNEIVIYGGAVHLSKEELVLDDGRSVWGQVVELDGNGQWSDPVPGAYVTKISQEHGIISCSDGFFRKTGTGNFLGILPVHSCLTADLMKGYLTTRGERILF